MKRRPRRARGRATFVPLALSALLLPLLGAPRAAWALCPNCLGQNSALTPTLKLVGLFLVVPFAVASTVYLVLRRLLRGAA